jgi:NADP-dependent 3-hydroxy acid dehydrogenase YdfG
MSTFLGRVAVVTGASSGIGKAIAQALAAEGATLCLIGRDLDRLKAVTASLPASKSNIFNYQADLLIDADIHRLVATIASEHGRIDLLIHSAGIIFMGNIETAKIEDFDRQYQLNVRASYLLTQKALPLIKACQGQIGFINSSVCLNARAGIAQYTATKQALKAVADCLRAEVNTDGIRVMSFYLGRTNTPMQAAIYQQEGRTYQPDLAIQPEDVAETVLQTLAISHTAEITDVNIRPMKNLSVNHK